MLESSVSSCSYLLIFFGPLRREDTTVADHTHVRIFMYTNKVLPAFNFSPRMDDLRVDMLPLRQADYRLEAELQELRGHGRKISGSLTTRMSSCCKWTQQLLVQPAVKSGVHQGAAFTFLMLRGCCWGWLCAPIWVQRLRERTVVEDGSVPWAAELQIFKGLILHVWIWGSFLHSSFQFFSPFHELPFKVCRCKHSVWLLSSHDGSINIL